MPSRSRRSASGSRIRRAISASIFEGELMGMHLKVRINESDPTLVRCVCIEYIPIRTCRARQADRSNYRSGTLAGGFKRGSSLGVEPVGDFGSALFDGDLLVCVLPVLALAFFLPVSGGVS